MTAMTFLPFRVMLTVYAVAAVVMSFIFFAKLPVSLLVCPSVAFPITIFVVVAIYFPFMNLILSGFTVDGKVPPKPSLPFMRQNLCV